MEQSNTAKKIDVIVNKTWEFQPFFSALAHSNLVNRKLPRPTNVYHDLSEKGVTEPLAIIHLTENYDVMLHCIENRMDPNPADPTYYSNSEAKVKFIEAILNEDKPHYVISVSTAESTPDLVENPTDSINGSVLLGSRYYMFDAREYDPSGAKSKLEVVEHDISSIPEHFYNTLNSSYLANCSQHFVPTKNAPSDSMFCRADMNYTSIGVVNITDYRGYAKGDPAAYEECKSRFPKPCDIPASIETTHGIVRMNVKKVLENESKTQVPTLFVSPITDRYKHFSDDVDSNGIQNYIEGFNAGIATSEVLVALMEYYNG